MEGACSVADVAASGDGADFSERGRLDWDELRAHGVWDPDSPRSGEREALLRHLEAKGATTADVVAAYDGKYLNTVAGDMLVSAPAVHTLRDVSEHIGISVERTEDAIRAAGLPVPGPDAAAFSDADIDLLRRLAPALDLFPRDEALQMLRVISSSLARIADAAVTAYLTNVESRISSAGGSELEHAKAVEHAITVLGGAVDAMGPLLARHLERSIQRSRAARSGVGGYDVARLAVGFVDLVGFTPLSLSVPPSDLGALVGEFEAIASDLVAEYDGRLVKLLGDEVMFVAVDPVSACAIALGLVEAFSDSERGLAPRGGLAYGEMVTRAGDYYGPQVNMASRVAAHAVPREILVTDGVQSTVEDQYECVPAGYRMLKGFADPVAVWSLERRQQGDQ